MKTRTNQPVFLDNGQKVDDNALGGTQLYKHVVTVEDSGSNTFNIELISIRGTAYQSLTTISSDKNYEVLSFGIIVPEDTPKQIIAIENSGMGSFLICYVSGGANIDYIDVIEMTTDVVTPL